MALGQQILCKEQLCQSRSCRREVLSSLCRKIPELQDMKPCPCAELLHCTLRPDPPGQWLRTPRLFPSNSILDIGRPRPYPAPSPALTSGSA